MCMHYELHVHAQRTAFLYPLQSFVTCSLGIWKVGLVALPFGVVNAIVSLTSGHLVKHIGRIPIFVFGTLL